MPCIIVSKLSNQALCGKSLDWFRDRLSTSVVTWQLCVIDLDLDGFQSILVEAHPIYLDLVSNMEIAFRLSVESITSLSEYHKAFLASISQQWDDSATARHKQFKQALHRFFFRASITTLDDIKEDGSGKLDESTSHEAKAALLHLFWPIVSSTSAPITPTSTRVDPTMIKYHDQLQELLASIRST